MRNFTLLLVSLLLFSCQKNSEQIASVKEKIKAYRSDNNPDDYSYEVRESSANDVYKLIRSKYNTEMEHYEAMGDTEGVAHILRVQDSLLKEQELGKGKKFYIVHSYKMVDNDTTKSMLFFLNDKNEVISKKSK